MKNAMKIAALRDQENFFHAPKEDKHTLKKAGEKTLLELYSGKKHGNPWTNGDTKYAQKL